MDKENFLKQVEQSNLSDEDKKLWREATGFLSSEVVEAIAKEWAEQPSRLEEITVEIKVQKEKINHYV